MLDWERGGKVTGARFLFYKGLGARLERAIYNFMLDEHGKEGYTEVITPYMVNHDSMFGTGQYPKFKEDTFELKDTNYVLIPTAEVPLQTTTVMKSLTERLTNLLHRYESIIPL